MRFSFERQEVNGIGELVTMMVLGDYVGWEEAEVWGMEYGWDLVGEVVYEVEVGEN